MRLTMSEKILIRLKGELGVASAAEIKARLEQALATEQDLAISLEDATEIDATVMQLLYAAGLEASRRGRGYAFEGAIPATIGAALDEAGMTPLLPTPNAS
jgi:anti-anti-sigma regulatory factor